MRKLLLMFTLLCPCVVAPVANAASWPIKPLRLIVPYSAGGPTDGVARLIAQHLEEQLGQTVVVQNRPGAGGAIGVGKYCGPHLTATHWRLSRLALLPGYLHCRHCRINYRTSNISPG